MLPQKTSTKIVYGATRLVEGTEVLAGEPEVAEAVAGRE